MWVAKIELEDDKDIISARTKKFKVTVVGKLLSKFVEKGIVHLQGAGLVLGEEERIKQFLKDLKRDKNLVRIETKGHFYVMEIKKPQIGAAETIVEPFLIYPSPVIARSDGVEVWEFAHWKREEINKKIRLAQKMYKTKVISVKKQQLSNMSFIDIRPDLTKKQQQAIELAVKEGYYSFPRKTDMHQLAAIKKSSYSNMQEHLKKAENKVINAFYQRYRS
jgi:predicted DNA binding protein